MMQHSGYQWTIRPSGDAWTWQAMNRDDGSVAAQGAARTRAEAAAFLVRAIARGVSDGAEPRRLAA
jgi:hypothetical protein